MSDPLSISYVVHGKDDVDELQQEFARFQRSFRIYNRNKAAKEVIPVVLQRDNGGALVVTLDAKSYFSAFSLNDINMIEVKHDGTKIFFKNKDPKTAVMADVVYVKFQEV